VTVPGELEIASVHSISIELILTVVYFKAWTGMLDFC